MENKTLGKMIAELRKKQNMTQLQLADQMGVTDKAVSKWERDVACPDVNTLGKLAEVLQVSVNELMQSNTKKNKKEEQENVQDIVNLILKVIPLAMGIAVTVLAVLKEIDLYSGLSMLGIGLACIGINQLQKK